MLVRFLCTKVAPAVAVGATAVTIYSSAAHAFFPPVPNGTDVVVTPPPVNPITPLPPPVVPPIPPVVPPPFVPPPLPPVVHPKDKCDPPTRPEEVPEPATAVTALVGLSLLGAATMKKKFGKRPAA